MKTTPKMLRISRNHQTGVVLITGLIFMVVLTILAVAAMRSTTLEERMTGNARDRDMAFQSAEAALRAGEQVLTGASLPVFTAGTANTPRIAAGTQVTYWKTTHNWTQSTAMPWAPAGTYSAPRYVIEEMGITAGTGGGGLGIGPIADSGVYRITARGVGSSANTMVILQAVYER
ncbi:MAG: pilus assembly PilX family protein [Thiobacillus sp.]